MSRDPSEGRSTPTRIAAAFFVLLPLGSAVTIPVGDVVASGSDVLVGLVVLAGLFTVFVSSSFRWAIGDAFSSATGLLRRSRATGSSGFFAAAVLLLGVFGIWTAASGLWGFHPAYSLTKGVGYLALAFSVGFLAWSALDFEVAADAWLMGTLLTVTLCLVLSAAAGLAEAAGDGGGAVGAAGASTGWIGRVFYSGGSVSGLPVDRVRWPFLHPNGLGDYLVLSGAILWARWPALPISTSARWIGFSLLAATLALTFSSAWLAAGVLILGWGRILDEAAPGGAPRVMSVAIRGAGASLSAATLAGLVFPLRFSLAGWVLETSGIRTQIWFDGLRAFLSDPLLGVGAAPVLADAVGGAEADGAMLLWDAHNLYLSVLGQTGLVGGVLVGGAAVLLVLALRRPRRPDGAADLHVVGGGGDSDVADRALLRNRARRGLLAGLAAMAVHGIVIAGEDIRHWWAFLALIGIWVATPGPTRANREAGP